jgi:hypothetical protein
VGDIDVDLYAPELVRKMLAEGTPMMNEKVLVGGERTIFKNTVENVDVLPPDVFYGRFPKVRRFVAEWAAELGRDLDIKLRIELVLPPKPAAGPIEFFRKAQP